MSQGASLTAGIAARYATALFELSKEANDLPALERDVGTLSRALSESGDLRRAIQSPVYAREDTANALSEVARRLGIGDFFTNALSIMAMRRRLFILPQLLQRIQELIEEEFGIERAEAVSASPLSGEQFAILERTLAEKTGKRMKIDLQIDRNLVGGMIVRVGSRMVDSSIRTKLNKLENAMKEVG